MLKNDRSPDQYSQTIETAIPKLESLGFDNFRSELPDHMPPKGLTQKNGEINFFPDIVAIRNGKKAYIEIAKKTDQLLKLVSKWQLISASASANKEFFCIVASKGLVKFVKKILNTHNISASLIRI